METASSRAIPSEGTDFGKALELSRLKFKEIAGKGAKISSRIIILVSDGEDFGEDTDDVVSELEKEGIRVFSLGVGTREGGPLPDGNGGFIADDEGNQVEVRLQTEDLKSISSRTGGRYFEINRDKNDVQSLIEAIQNIEGEVWDVQVVDIGANKYFYFLFFGLVVLLLDMLFTINLMRV